MEHPGLPDIQGHHPGSGVLEAVAAAPEHTGVLEAVVAALQEVTEAPEAAAAVREPRAQAVEDRPVVVREVAEAGLPVEGPQAEAAGFKIPFYIH